MELWQFGIGLGVSVSLAFLRFRFPAIPAQLASAGIGTGLALVALSFIWPGWPLSISIMLNAALGAAFIDQRLTAKVPPSAESDVTAQAEFLKQQRLAAKEARAAAPDTPPQRRLTEGEKSAITRHAIGYAGTGDAPAQLTVVHNSASRAAIRCAEDIAEALTTARWEVQERGTSGHKLFPPTGIGLAFYDYGALAPDQRVIKEAFELAGIPFDIVSAETVPMARTAIFVTDPD